MTNTKDDMPFQTTYWVDTAGKIYFSEYQKSKAEKEGKKVTELTRTDAITKPEAVDANKDRVMDIMAEALENVVKNCVEYSGDPYEEHPMQDITNDDHYVQEALAEYERWKEK